MDLKTAEILMHDPAAFRSVLRIDVDGVPVPLADVIDPWQAQDFAAMDAAWQRVCGRPCPPVAHSRAYLERPRGHSKTADLAVSCTWALFAARGAVSGVCAAADRDQARLLRSAIERLVRLNPWLAAMLDVQRDVVRNRHNGAELQIIGADLASSWGLTPDFVVVDELTHWDREGMWHSLVSAAAKRPSCVMVVISNAGLGEGSSWQWSAREACRTSPGWYFRRLDGPQASWITPAMLDEQKRLLPPSVYQRLWGNVWTYGVGGDAIPPALIDASVTMPRRIGVRIPGFLHVAGLDVGVRRDRCALVVLAVDRESRLIRLVDVRQWTPANCSGGQVDLRQVREAIREAHRKWDLYAMASDTWQAEFLGQELLDDGLYVRLYHPTGPNLTMQARATLQLFQDGLFSMYPCPELIRDLQSLRVVERQGGGLRLEAPRSVVNQHADAAFALSVIAPGALELLDHGIAEPAGETTFGVACV